VSEIYKTQEGKLYYVTLTVVGWIDVFTRKEYVYELIKNIQYCQENKGLEIYAYVIMSNHVHLICKTEKTLLSYVLRDLKSFTAKKIVSMIQENQQESRKDWLMYMFRFFGTGNSQNKDIQFWQHGSHAIELWKPEVIKQKINYLHNNPVKAGYVAEPHHYLYSSANEFSELKVLKL
jgi:REP element-mobilizing transposase RayT